MIRTDGSYCIYTIQHDYHKDGKWVMSNLDTFGVPPYPAWKRTMPFPDCFNAVGRCWQETGIRGVYGIDVAIEGLKWIREKNPNMLFRLAVVYIKQDTVSLTY